MICPKCGRPRATKEDEIAHNTGDCGCLRARSLCWQDYCGQCNSVFDPDNIGTYLRGFCQPSGCICHYCNQVVERWNVRHEGYFSCTGGCDNWQGVAYPRMVGVSGVAEALGCSILG